MSKSYDDLYVDYKNSISSLVNEDSDFYGDLCFNIESGNNNLSLFHRYFEKKIDLKWVDAIEKCIVPLDTIIRNPRKFIVQEEEIVPIERARKITAESVRHLAQHTNMIARVDGDRVTPSQILNVFREESFEIYENRFIYTLIKNVQHFIDGRYNVLFNMADDENMASMKMESEVKNGNEVITYKLEIATKSAGSGHDAQSGETVTAFQRIERVKRIINEFAASAFMRELQGCTPVRPPIMRTNVISKDPNFKACLNLWQFISAYSDVGYEIIAKESNEEVNDEYRQDLNNLFGMNYMLLKKNIMPEEALKNRVKKRKLKPKMLKRLAEELVLNYDMEEVEIRRIFVDEMKRVSKKKIEGEAKIKEAIARALQSEADRKAAIAEKIRLEEERKKEIERRRKEREAARIAKQKALEKERKEKERARQKAKKEKELALAKAKAAKERERIRLQKEKERLAKEKAAKLEKERIAKQKEKERLAKEKAIQLEKEKKAAAKKKEAEKLAREKALQAEKLKAQKAKQREKERLAREKAKQLEAEKARKIKEKEKEKAAKEKALQAEREKLAREKAKQKEKERKAKEKLKEKQRLEKQKAAQKERERIAKEKQKEKERLQKEKAKQNQKSSIDKSKASQ